LQLFLKVAAPTVRQSFQVDGPLQVLTIIGIESVQLEDVGNGEAVCIARQELDRVSAINLAFLSD
jgi:hypothetical protein